MATPAGLARGATEERNEGEKKRNETLSLRKSAADIAQCRVLKWRDDRERRRGAGSHCQNPRPRYRSTHRHTLEERVRIECTGGASQSETEGETHPPAPRALRYTTSISFDLTPSAEAVSPSGGYSKDNVNRPQNDFGGKEGVATGDASVERVPRGVQL